MRLGINGLIPLMRRFDISLFCQRVRRVAKSVIERPGLGGLKVVGPHPNHAYCTFRNPPSTVGDPVALLVQLWPAGSKVVFYECSHLRSLNVETASTGWFGVSLEELQTKKVNPIELIMKDGGL